MRFRSSATTVTSVVLTAALLAALPTLLAGCMVDADPPRREPVPLGPEAFEPRTDIGKVVAMGEATVSDSDGDGLPDGVQITCLLFPLSGEVPVFGKGSFRFEVYDAAEPARTREPLAQPNYNADQISQYRGLYRGMPCYVFRLPLRDLAPNVRSIFIRGRFFPEGGEEAVPGSATVPVPKFTR